MTTHYQKHNREFIDHAVSMVTGGDGRHHPPSLRAVARELGVGPSTFHNWVDRVAREATAGHGNASLAEPRQTTHVAQTRARAGPCRPPAPDVAVPPTASPTSAASTNDSCG